MKDIYLVVTVTTLGIAVVAAIVEMVGKAVVDALDVVRLLKEKTAMKK